MWRLAYSKKKKKKKRKKYMVIVGLNPWTIWNKSNEIPIDITINRSGYSKTRQGGFGKGSGGFEKCLGGL